MEKIGRIWDSIPGAKRRLETLLEVPAEEWTEETEERVLAIIARLGEVECDDLEPEAAASLAAFRDRAERAVETKNTLAHNLRTMRDLEGALPRLVARKELSAGAARRFPKAREWALRQGFKVEGRPVLLALAEGRSLDLETYREICERLRNPPPPWERKTGANHAGGHGGGRRRRF